MNVTHTTVVDLGEGWTPQGWTIALACGHVTDGVAHMRFSIGDSMLCTEEHAGEPLPRRIPRATISPAFLAEIDEPIPYVPVDLIDNGGAVSVTSPIRHTNEPCDLRPRFSSQAGVAAHQYSPTRYGAPIPSGGAVTKLNPAPSDDSTPSLVRLDQAGAAQRLAAAAATLLGRWNGIYTDTGVIEARNDLRQALADFRWVS